MMKGNISIHAVTTWLTILSLVVGAFSFFESAHSGYVTHSELEIALLKRDKENLEDEVEHFD
jgi:hypothetical protein